MKWISVKDRLPDEEGLYLAASKTWVRIERFGHGCSRFEEPVTHWMTLPNPPDTETKDYQQQIKRTIPQGMEKDKKLAMLCMGLSGETGEVVDHVKKHLFQGHKLEKDVIIDECGDVLWYLTNLLTEVGATLEETQEKNIEKLMKRYPNGFDSDKSINRM